LGLEKCERWAHYLERGRCASRDAEVRAFERVNISTSQGAFGSIELRGKYCLMDANHQMPTWWPSCLFFSY
jgi:hypothetical protein